MLEQPPLPLALPVYRPDLPKFEKHYRANPAEEEKLGALSLLRPDERRKVIAMPPRQRRQFLRELHAIFRKRLYMRHYMRKYPRSKPKLNE